MKVSPEGIASSAWDSLHSKLQLNASMELSKQLPLDVLTPNLMMFLCLSSYLPITIGLFTLSWYVLNKLTHQDQNHCCYSSLKTTKNSASIYVLVEEWVTPLFYKENIGPVCMEIEETKCIVQLFQGASWSMFLSYQKYLYICFYLKGINWPSLKEWHRLFSSKGFSVVIMTNQLINNVISTKHLWYCAEWN